MSRRAGVMPGTVMLTLGRLPKALDIARSFAMQGWRVIIAEPFRQHLAGASNMVARSYQVTAPAVSKRRYLAELAAIIAAEKVDWVIPVSEETMHVTFLRELVPASVRIFTMPPEALLPAYDKHGFIHLAQSAGVSVPETHALGSPAGEALARLGPVVVKPVHSCSGRGVRILAQGAPLPSEAGSVVQRFIPGEVHSSCSIAQAGQVLSTVIYRGALFSGSVAIAFERVVEPVLFEAWIARFVRHVNWTGFISFDFVLDAQGVPHGIECNPRTTSGLHFFETADLAPAILEARPPRFRQALRLQQFYSCLTETQKSVLTPRRFPRNLHALLTTPDVTWNRQDKRPFLTMTWTSWEIIRRAMQAGTTFGEVATLDVGWYEGEGTAEGGTAA
ncbi:ATP-grasp domain-containing protein [Sediminicoccus sp. KRV36]|uniref:ATP-grasp domain-containing protein n=1 Tax=Sediminicoccus sp. KRV36 TaxID=3133721 RepID=UPI00200F8A39|nr:ATP-grasp domain-containing protein [Sediminicoccus rosea]UPY35436.1 ATP-grasp domain-containing protein [Sediminicoccus rosea]